MKNNKIILLIKKKLLPLQPFRNKILSSESAKKIFEILEDKYNFKREVLIKVERQFSVVEKQHKEQYGSANNVEKTL